jgi:hypothetical protein
VTCLIACGCQTGGPRSDQDCPSYNLCGDPDSDAVLTPSPDQLPGCPSSLQVMVRPIVFHADRPDDDAPGVAPDASDSVCEGPEPSLLRAAR